MMEQIIVEVGFVDGNYSAHLPQLPGCVTVGTSLKEIEDNMAEIVPFHLEGQKEQGVDVPAIFNGEYKFIFKLSIEAIINYYSGIFTKAALSRITGINERQLWHYAAGLRKPRPQQRKRIEEGLHRLGEELISLTL
ncbi:MAG TPA: type II toxin-antitoxin system HicB family antitoxin [Prolixibacteraceae bacterium]|jgi:predicted RNase H-like HicB family nuclease